MDGWYIGNGLKSGSWDIPDHISSEGVPSSLKILFNWSSTSLPGNKGLPAFASSAKMQPAQKNFILINVAISKSEFITLELTVLKFFSVKVSVVSRNGWFQFASLFLTSISIDGKTFILSLLFNALIEYFITPIFSLLREINFFDLISISYF